MVGADPTSTFLEVKTTPKVPLSVAAGVHVSVPDVLPAPGVNTALFPGGSQERSAASERSASASGSSALTLIVSCTPGFASTCLGALTVGLWSGVNVASLSGGRSCVSTLRVSVLEAVTSSDRVSPVVPWVLPFTLMTGPFVVLFGDV